MKKSFTASSKEVERLPADALNGTAKLRAFKKQSCAVYGISDLARIASPRFHHARFETTQNETTGKNCAAGIVKQLDVGT